MVTSACGGNINIYPTGIGSSVALVHLAMVDDSKYEKHLNTTNNNENEQDTPESKPKLKIVLDIVHRLTDSFRVERVASIDNKEKVNKILKIGARHLMALTDKRAYTFKGAVSKKSQRFKPELVARSHIYGLYSKQEVVDSILSQDFRYLALVVKDTRTLIYSLSISDLNDPNMIDEVGNTQQLGYNFMDEPKFTKIWF